MAAGDIRITGTTSGNVRVTKTAGDTRVTSAAAGLTLEATPGVLTLAGQAADQVISGSLTLEATAGTLTLTGQAADQVTTGNLALEATAGTVSLTGQTGDYAITLSEFFEVPPGTIALTGATADLSIPLTLEATPGTLLLAGVFADVTGLAAQPAVSTAAGVRRGRAYPRAVIIGKRRHKVESAEQEYALLRHHISEQARAAEVAEAKSVSSKPKVRQIRLTQTRVQKLAEAEPDIQALLLRQIDEEIVLIVGSTPWL